MEQKKNLRLWNKKIIKWLYLSRRLFKWNERWFWKKMKILNIKENLTKIL